MSLVTTQSHVPVLQRPGACGWRCGDILLATSRPHDISACNIIPGVLTSLERRDFMITAQVDCGIRFEVHLTPGARDSLQLRPGREVWLVLKTHSCQLVAPSP